MWHPAFFAMLFSVARWGWSTPGHPGIEYSQDVFFHNMVKGYARRVHNPADADLFYVPVYTQRLQCHPDHGEWEKLLMRIADIVGGWIARFPAKDGLGPKFFSASGSVCSCREPKLDIGCNPVSANRSLDDKAVTLAWESPVPGLHMSMPNVVVPYISTLHDILPWGVEHHRKLLVTMAAGVRPTKCTYCGPCGRFPRKLEGKGSMSDDNRTCACGCNNRRRELRKMFADAENISDIKMVESIPEEEDRYRMKLRATFCIEPTGDCVSRKSFYESIMLGCIPVVPREDSLYLDQLPFSHTIPYRRLWVAIPPGTTDIFGMLRAISHEDIVRRRRIIKRYGRRLTFASNNSEHGGYNDFRNPDAFLSALKDVWDRSKSELSSIGSHRVKPILCEDPPCAAATCKLANKDKYSKDRIWAIANLSASDFPKVYILPLSRNFTEDLLSCSAPWMAGDDDVRYFAHTSPELPFGPVGNKKKKKKKKKNKKKNKKYSS